MTWNFFSIVDATDDNPALYPILSGPTDTLPIAWDPLDGTTPSYYTAGAATVLGLNAKGALASMVSLPADLELSIIVTDARLIVYCVKFDKGGGWRGFSVSGLAVAAAANAVSHARASARRKGRVLVAHARYPWVERVLATPKIDRGTTGRIRVRVNANPSGDSRYVMLELAFGKQVDAMAVGNDVARRAAHYRLAHDPTMEAAEREKFVALAGSPVLQPATRTTKQSPAWATYQMPTSYRVTSRTAFPKPRQDEVSPSQST